MVTVLGVGGGVRLGAMVLLAASGRGPKLSLTRTVGFTVGVGPAVNLQDDSGVTEGGRPGRRGRRALRVHAAESACQCQ